MEQEDKKFSDQILEKIQSGNVTMHSKAFLIWRATLWVLAIGLLLAALAFVVSFVLFATRASGIWDLPGFGPHGLREFLTYFPWLFVPAVLLFLWLLARFTREHSPAYRFPMVYLAAGIVAVVVFASFLLYQTPLHPQLYRSAAKKRLPAFGMLYQFFGQARPDDFYVGDVLSASSSVYSLKTAEGRQLKIVASGQTRFFGPMPIAAGDYVEVLGEENNGAVNAQSIKKVDPGSIYPLRHYDRE